MYLLPSLSQSYVFDIEAVMNITFHLCLRARWKVISTMTADSTQRMAQSLPSWRGVLSSSRGWAAATGRRWSSTASGERTSLGQSVILGVLSCLEMLSGDGTVQAVQWCSTVQQLWLHRGTGESSPGGSLNLGIIYFISWETGCGFKEFFGPSNFSLFWADS